MRTLRKRRGTVLTVAKKVAPVPLTYKGMWIDRIKLAIGMMEGG